MPILLDIADHKIFGPAIREAREQGRREGKQGMLHRLLEKRFGPISDSVEKRLTVVPTDDLDDVAVRILDASSFEDLFPQNQ